MPIVTSCPSRIRSRPPPSLPVQMLPSRSSAITHVRNESVLSRRTKRSVTPLRIRRSPSFPPSQTNPSRSMKSAWISAGTPSVEPRNARGPPGAAGRAPPVGSEPNVTAPVFRDRCYEDTAQLSRAGPKEPILQHGGASERAEPKATVSQQSNSSRLGMGEAVRGVERTEATARQACQPVSRSDPEGTPPSSSNAVICWLGSGDGSGAAARRPDSSR